jgi:hypothetical protein
MATRIQIRESVYQEFARGRFDDFRYRFCRAGGRISATASAASTAGVSGIVIRDRGAPMTDPRQMLRHTLATLAYRAAKSCRGAPAGFEGLRASPTTRTPVEILAHMGDLMDWGLAMSRGAPAWRNSTPLPWDREVERFFAAVTAWDDFLASGAELRVPVEKLFQGPVADALTHTGQINLLRRMAESPVRGESYNRASIAAGQTGFEQPPPDPRNEFD